MEGGSERGKGSAGGKWTGKAVCRCMLYTDTKQRSSETEKKTRTEAEKRVREEVEEAAQGMCVGSGGEREGGKRKESGGSVCV